MFDENGDARLIRTHLWLSDQSKIWPPDPRYDSLRKFFGTDPYNRSLTTIDLGRGATPPTITADNGKKRLTYSDGVFRDESGQVVEHMDIERFEEVAGAILHLATAKADELLMLRLQK